MAKEEYFDYKKKSSLQEGLYKNLDSNEIGFVCKEIYGWVFKISEDEFCVLSPISSRYLEPMTNEKVQEEIDITRERLNFLTSKLEQLAQPVDSDFKSYQEAINTGAISNNFPTRER